MVSITWRAICARPESEAFKAGAGGKGAADDESAVVGGRAALLLGEEAVMSYWMDAAAEAASAVPRKAAGAVGMTQERRLMMSEVGRCRLTAG
jgi:hypothetical protein